MKIIVEHGQNGFYTFGLEVEMEKSGKDKGWSIEIKMYQFCEIQSLSCLLNLEILARFKGYFSSNKYPGRLFQPTFRAQNSRNNS